MRLPTCLVVVGIALSAGIGRADIVIDPDSVEKYTEILFPFDGQVFVVPNEHSTIEITALGYSTIGYFTRATLDVEPFTGQANGGTLTHYYAMDFDGEVADGRQFFIVPDGPDLVPPDQWDPPEWLFNEVAVDFDVLAITRNCGVGIHMVVLEHEVYDNRSEIHAYDYDWVTFYVVPAPLPGCASMGIVSFVCFGLFKRPTPRRLEWQAGPGH